MKKAVITGGAGFVGSHLAEELSKRDYHVIILDNLFTGKLENIAPLLEKGNVEFIQDSITDLPLLQRLFRGVDYVFHLAAIASVPRSIEAPRECHEVNATGTLNVLIAARDNKVKKVINSSSCAVYGDAPDLPKKEAMLPIPLSPYAATKVTGEQYCQVFQQVYNLPTVSLRYFNIYGPRQDPNSEYAAVIPRFIKMAVQGESPNIYGDGEQSRDFIFVRDVVSANILFAGNNAGGIFNIGSGQSTTINALVQTIGQLAGSKVTPTYKPSRAGDIRHSLADVAQAGACGYHPKFKLEQGLKETLRHMIP